MHVCADLVGTRCRTACGTLPLHLRVHIHWPGSSNGKAAWGIRGRTRVQTGAGLAYTRWRTACCTISFAPAGAQPLAWQQQWQGCMGADGGRTAMQTGAGLADARWRTARDNLPLHLRVRNHWPTNSNGKAAWGQQGGEPQRNRARA